MKPKLYVMALHAVKADPSVVKITEYADGSYRWEMVEGATFAGLPVMLLSAYLILAASHEEAEAAGMRKILEEAPAREGWISHHVTLNTVSREQLADVLGRYDDMLAEVVEDGGEGEPERPV
jgi:hypothetical protein